MLLAAAGAGGAVFGGAGAGAGTTSPFGGGLGTTMGGNKSGFGATQTSPFGGGLGGFNAGATQAAFGSIGDFTVGGILSTHHVLLKSTLLVCTSSTLVSLC